MHKTQSLSQTRTSPWRFVPSLYFVQGLPYATVALLSPILFASLGVPNTKMAFWTSFLQLPWVIKPLWSPLVETGFSKRRWIWLCQCAMGILCLVLASALPFSHFFLVSIAAFYLIAFVSSTHDIAADGFYILSLPKEQQASFVGIRSTAFRLALITANGGLVYLAGYLQRSTSVTQSWTAVFSLLALLLFSLGIWHRIQLPYPADDRAASRPPLGPILRSFFLKEKVLWAIAFLLLYRLGEAQLCKISPAFLLAERAKGGLGLTMEQLGLYQGSFGVAALLAGGVLGGLILARWGLQRCFLPFWAAINLPNLLYVYLAYAQPESQLMISSSIVIEQFGYGLGFSAYMLFMVELAGESEWKAVHYALATAFMALSLMIPGMFSGVAQEALGYPHFFLWVLLCSLPCLWAIRALTLPTSEL